MKPDYNSEYGRGNVVIHRLQGLSSERLKRKGEGYREFVHLDTNVSRTNDEPNVNERRLR